MEMGAARKEQSVQQLQTSYVRQHEELITKRKERKKRVLRRLVIFGLFTILVCGSGISILISQAKEISAKEKQLMMAQEEYEQLLKEEIMLEEEIVRLNDDEYIAKLARKEYFLSEKDEIIFVLPESNTDK